ncbi:MAG: hypothetical protein KJ732_06265 [Candidatus Margulisbacteria bacterium]|nr:hypothetical protein [Candidatus Margulisiibacteriota bacterium]
MAIFECPVCESKIDVPEQTKLKERLTCPSCFSQLSLQNYKGKNILTCAVCKEPVFDPVNCEDCDRLRDKQKLLDEGRL